ncbi:RNA polymerase sigma-70 factor [Paenibacillus filicis]|uniref:RNA polymerase sigma-70 factor n=1 Tax=Paenibacillus gyeongsangnamensis TaxID=3388067 RepID=A0ABT4QCQ9_9BACL|nr:RNA polymerase sigma-70 factor [Paenibacillus filicis]MCZ8514668.1 RNA polymerase sigma-70 factor [Paenibacillus filicis]
MESVRLEAWYAEYKPLLFSIAYRMLGTVSEAEDIVQDTFAAVHRLSEAEIQNPKAFLCKMVTNRCIDDLRSARKQREMYTGPWLPEPVVSDRADDPALHAERRDDISFAMLLLYEQLNPVERAIFILREAFDYDYKDIADILDKNEAACRKTYSRLKSKLHARPSGPAPEELPALQPLLHGFLQAVQTGDMAEMLQVLSEDAVLYSDGGGKVRAALFPIVSAERVAAFLHGITRKREAGTRMIPGVFNGMPSIAVLRPSGLQNVTLFEFAGERIHRIYIVNNPDKLKHVAVER